MSWIPLAILAPFVWAISNFVDKYTIDRYTKGSYDFVFLSALCTWPFFFGLLFFVGVPDLTLYSLLPIMAGMMLTYSYGFYSKALEHGDTSTLVALFNLIPVVTLALAALFLGQQLNLQESAAFVIILFGSFIISLERWERRPQFIKGLGLILISIFLWASLSVISDYAVEKMPFWDFMLLDTFGSAIAGFGLFLFKPMREEIWHGFQTGSLAKYSAFISNVALDFIGQISLKRAFSLSSSVALVNLVTQTQSFFAISIGLVLTILFPRIIQEDISGPLLAKKLFGAGIMFIGVALLAL